MALLTLRELEVSYGPTPLVGPVTMAIGPGEIVGLIGESGGGKSTLGKAIIGDLPASAAIHAGELTFDGVALRAATPRTWRSVRWKQIAYIPQAALNVLNPVCSIRAQFADMVHDHYNARLRGEWLSRVIGALVTVNLDETVLDRFPHELSGGMRQRVCIAMAMLFEPRLIVADEPTSALDVVSQRLVIETLQRLRDSKGTAILLVGHDLAIMAQVADRIGILFGGQLIETGTAAEIFGRPTHPYTQLLLRAVPSIRSRINFADVPVVTDDDRRQWARRDVAMTALSETHLARLGT